MMQVTSLKYQVIRAQTINTTLSFQLYPTQIELGDSVICTGELKRVDGVGVDNGLEIIIKFFTGTSWIDLAYAYTYTDVNIPGVWFVQLSPTDLPAINGIYRYRAYFAGAVTNLDEVLDSAITFSVKLNIGGVSDWAKYLKYAAIVGGGIAAVVVIGTVLTSKRRT